MTRNKMSIIIVMSWALVTISEVVVYKIKPEALESSFHHMVPWTILSIAIIFTVTYVYVIYTLI